MTWSLIVRVFYMFCYEEKDGSLIGKTPECSLEIRLNPGDSFSFLYQNSKWSSIYFTTNVVQKRKEKRNDVETN